MKRILSTMAALLFQSIIYACAYAGQGYANQSKPIETPNINETNDFMIKAPFDWGYKALPGKNGLIGILWPFESSLKNTDTAMFVFLQNTKLPLPQIPENINIFTEKCTKAMFKFYKGPKKDSTKSIYERYFEGNCGKTMILFHESVENYNIILAFVSSKNVTQDQLNSAKSAVAAYKREIQKYLDAIVKTTSGVSKNNSNAKKL